MDIHMVSVQGNSWTSKITMELVKKEDQEVVATATLSTTDLGNGAIGAKWEVFSNKDVIVEVIHLPNSRGGVLFYQDMRTDVDANSDMVLLGIFADSPNGWGSWHVHPDYEILWR